MPFDQPTRNRLAKFVAQARDRIAEEFTDQLQAIHGISADGRIAAVADLGHLDDPGRALATRLRERIDYLVASHPDDKGGRVAAVNRLARELAFTVLNRLAAIRMAEARGLIQESVGRSYLSKGFKVFESVAGASALGDTYARYRRYLFCLFDELAVDLGVLFDRRSPLGVLFPREKALVDLLSLLNAPDLEALWAEDETIGWIYQYYNDETERKRMREQSSAPRNSRELAVRNQFFTPRYVVEFLTDNTLGRTWYEMTRGQTRLTEQCRYLVRRPTEIFLAEGQAAPEVAWASQPASPAGFPARSSDSLTQEELLRQPVHIPHRELKDPREIRLLDPACGSMHFGLYAFDLFEVIYAEAYDLACHPGRTREGSPSPDSSSFAPFASFCSKYSSKADFLKDVPRLIIEHNIHGIDIDPRAAQIAGLSLWLRAQRAWHQMGVKPADRPRITRSNIVCAEPMPGDKARLREFVEQQFPVEERPVFQKLLETIFEKMELAGEAGSLLKIEEEIRTAIEDARQTSARLLATPRDLFAPENALAAQHLHPEAFFLGLEDRIYAALRAYAEQAESVGGFQRRLFADDAAHGFAFIDICRKRYDVVVMNPPFGDAVFSTEELLQKAYPNWCKNLASAFVRMATERFAHNGGMGVVADRTIIVKSSYEDFRREIHDHMSCLGDLGWEVLDANVEVTTFVLKQHMVPAGCFFDQRQVAEKDAELLSKVQATICGNLKLGAFCVVNSAIATLPNCAFAYDMPNAAIRIFEQFESLKQRGHRALQGHNLSMEQFGRLAWEVPVSSIHDQTFIRMYKGGEYSKLYQPSYEVALWFGNGGHLRGHSGTRWGNEQFQETPGIGYGKRGDFLDAHVMPAGQIFTVEGLTVFPKSLSDAWGLLAVLNSSACSYLLHFYSGQHKMSGYVKQLPVPSKNELKESHSFLCANIFRKKRIFDRANEVSPEFLEWPFLKISSESFQSSADKLINDQRAIRDAVAALDKAVSISFGLDHARLLEDAFVKTQPVDVLSIAFDIGDASATRRTLADTFLHYLLGCVFGRWDIRYATGERPAPELPDPFEPLPVCPPGMLQGDDGLPLSPEAGRRLRAVGRYPLDVAWDGILVEDPELPLDLEGCIHSALAIVWGEHADALEHEACALLGVSTLREWFRRPAGFFADHLKRYSKSRRQAPIYWPLSTASGSYTLWIYYHRLNDQTLHTALADFVEPKLRSLVQEVARQREPTGNRDKLEEALELEAELKDFRDELNRIIQLPWKPNLNDGVLITASPLWKLFRLPKWQKDLKACWQELEAGDYDWAHLAHTIWPDRVREKCKTDRSLAIAHNLEALCTLEAPKPKGKKGRKKKEAEVQDGLALEEPSE